MHSEPGQNSNFGPDIVAVRRSRKWRPRQAGQPVRVQLERSERVESNREPDHIAQLRNMVDCPNFLDILADLGNIVAFCIKCDKIGLLECFQKNIKRQRFADIFP